MVEWVRYTKRRTILHEHKVRIHQNLSRKPLLYIFQTPNHKNQIFILP